MRMTNLKAVLDVLSRHREARQWTDEAVAADVLKALDMDGSRDVGAEAQEVKDAQDKTTRAMAAQLKAASEPKSPDPQAVAAQAFADHQGADKDQKVEAQKVDAKKDEEKSK
jgi:hypothetical protein